MTKEDELLFAKYDALRVVEAREKALADAIEHYDQAVLLNTPIDRRPGLFLTHVL